MRTNRLQLSGIVFRLLLAIGMTFVVTAKGAEQPKSPTEGWETVAPEAVGFDSAKLADALAEMHLRKLDIHSLTLIRHGRLFLDADFYPYDGRAPHNLASVTKSVTTGLIGIAAGQGKLRLDQPLLDFFPGRKIAHRDVRKERITVRQLTGMLSGLDCTFENGEPTLRAMFGSPDWAQFTLDLRMANEPGSTFRYCSPGMHLLSAILQQATGMTAQDFARQTLFAPLGIHDVIWMADPQGVSRGWGDLYLHPKDAAKIGLLWLNGGLWDGKQIVPRQWVEQSSTSHSKTSPNFEDDYGLGWWIDPSRQLRHFYAAGRGGQRISVLPSLDIVAVTTGGGFEPGEALALLRPSMTSPDKPLPPNPEGGKKLQEVIESLLLPPQAQPVPLLPDLASKVSGRVYRWNANDLHIATMRLDFDGGAEARLTLTYGDGQPETVQSVGIDGVYRLSPGPHGFSAGLRGSWNADKKFMLEVDTIANLDAYILVFTFSGEDLDIYGRERSDISGTWVKGHVLGK